MDHLTLVGLSGDKSRLLLVDQAGAEFTLDVDAHLRAAVRGDHARLGQLEIQMESTLRPRDIQARIRAGESADAVAAAAHTTVEKIMPFAGPVLAERAHVAERAQRASVRRRSTETGARTLGEAVIAHLQTVNVPSTSVEWDAARREDGRWTLSGGFQTPGRSGTARFAYDAPGNFVVAENDDATWLIGELEDAPAEPATDDLSTVRQRRLNSVPDEQQLALTEEGGEALALGDDALDLVAETPDVISTEDLTETVARVRETVVEDPDLSPRPSADAFLDRVFAAQNPEPRSPVPAPAELHAAGDDETVHALSDGDEESARELPHRREVKKNRGRASVPSWDEIMFGSGNPD